MLEIQVGHAGPKDAKIAFVGEAPGADEVKTGEPFTGRAGGIFNTLLTHAGIIRSRVYITNVVKVRSNKNDISLFIKLGKSKTTGEVIAKVTTEYEAYREYLGEELAGCGANVFVPLGNVGLYTLTGNIEITKRRGSILPATLPQIEGRKVIPTIHPSAVQYSEKQLEQYYILHDFRRIREESEFPGIVLPKRDIITQPSFDECYSHLRMLKSVSQVAFDIEVMNEEVYCISFAAFSDQAFVIPFIAEDGNDYFNPSQEAEIWKLIAEVLEDRDVLKLGHNLTFDATFLYRRYGIITRNMGDTMIAHKLLCPDFPKGLDFVTSTYTKEPYYKDEGKKWFKLGVNYYKFLEYNGKDSAVVMEAYPELMNDLKGQNNIEAYHRQVSLIQPLMYMQERGMKVNLRSLSEHREKVRVRMDELIKEFEEICPGVNYRSPKQLVDWFYIHKGIKPYRNKGRPTIDKNAKLRLARRGFREAEILVELTELSTLMSRYLDMTIDDDGRIRCSFDPVGTVSGRLSSSETIFGTGSNMQNLPPEFVQHLIPDKGYYLVNIDLEQADMRVVAWVAPEPSLMQAFMEGKDVHCRTAAAIYKIPEDEVSDEDGPATTGDGRHSQRFWGKKINHALDYGITYKGLALQLMVTESEAKELLGVAMARYPGIRQYHSWVAAEMVRTRKLVSPEPFCVTRKFCGRNSDKLIREACSHIPQRTVGDIINFWGITFIFEYPNTFEGIELLDQIHDSILMQIPLSTPLESVAKMLNRIVSNLEQDLHFRGRTFNIPAEVEIGFKGDKLIHLSKPINPVQIERILSSAPEVADEQG